MGWTARVLVLVAACGGGGSHPGAGDDAPAGSGSDGSNPPVTWSVQLPADSEWQVIDVSRAQGKIVLFGELLPGTTGYPAGRLLALSTATGATVLDKPEAELYPSAIALDDTDGAY